MKPNQVKNIKIVSGAAVGLLLLYLVIPKKDTSGAAYDPTGNGNTIPGSTGMVFNAHTVANKLYAILVKSGFAGAWINSDDKSAIFAILTNVNEAQMRQVVTAFGSLAYNSVTGDQLNFNPFSGLDRHDLVFWLNNEMDSDGKFFLRTKYPNIF